MEDTGIDSKLQAELSEISNSDKCDRTTADQGRCNKHTYVLAILRHIQNTLNDMRFQQIFPQM